MLACKMQLLAIQGETEKSLQVYAELKRKFPEFLIDFYRVLDVAQCLVRNNRLEGKFLCPVKKWFEGQLVVMVQGQFCSFAQYIIVVLYCYRRNGYFKGIAGIQHSATSAG